jgi:hypothetical protein
MRPAISIGMSSTRSSHITAGVVHPRRRKRWRMLLTTCALVMLQALFAALVANMVRAGDANAERRCVDDVRRRITCKNLKGFELLRCQRVRWRAAQACHANGAARMPVHEAPLQHRLPYRVPAHSIVENAQVRRA